MDTEDKIKELEEKLNEIQEELFKNSISSGRSLKMLEIIEKDFYVKEKYIDDKVAVIKNIFYAAGDRIKEMERFTSLPADLVNEVERCQKLICDINRMNRDLFFIIDKINDIESLVENKVRSTLKQVEYEEDNCY